MKALLLSLLVRTLRAYVGGGVYDRLAARVALLAANPDLAGGAKMSAYLAFAAEECVILGETLVRAVAEIALLQLKRDPA
jgi:hypothetical protein